MIAETVKDKPEYEMYILYKVYICIIPYTI